MKDRISRILAAYEPMEIDHDPSLWPAAVLLLLHNQDGHPHILFQKRTDKVDAHKGQISFPGGGSDPGDRDLIYTAIRETHEEIGVLPDHIEIIGKLDQIKTISNFAVTPYVGWLDVHPYEWKFSHDEVAYLLEVPLRHLQDESNFVADRRFANGREIVMPAYKFQDDLIWGATARMLTNFLDLLAADID